MSSVRLGREAARAVERHAALGGDRAARGDLGAEAAQRGGGALEAGVEGDVLQPEVDLGVDEGAAGERRRCRRSAARRASRAAWRSTRAARRPGRRAPRAAASARASGTAPERPTSRPGPASGTRPEARRSRPRGPVERRPSAGSARCRGSRRRRRGRAAGCRSRAGRVAPSPAPRSSKLAVGSARVPPTRPWPVTEPASPWSPAARSMSDERERLQVDAEVDRAGAQRDRAARPGGEAARRADGRVEVEPAVLRWCRGASSASGGRPAARVAAEATSAAREVEAHVRRVARAGHAGGAVDAPGERRGRGWTVLAMSSGRSRRSSERSKASAIAPLRGQPAGADVERERGQLDRAAGGRSRWRARSGWRPTAPLAQAQRLERRGEAVGQPGELARDVGERADRQPGIGGEAHAVGLGLLGARRERGDVDAGEREVAGVERALRPWASRARPSPRRRARARRPGSGLATRSRARAATVTPCPVSAGAEREVGVEGAARLDQREGGERGDVGGAERRARPRWARRRAASGRRSAGSGRRRPRGRSGCGRAPTEATSPARRSTSSSSWPPPLRLPVTSAPSRLPSKPRRAAVRRRPISVPSLDRGVERHADRDALAGGAAGHGQRAAGARVDQRRGRRGGRRSRCRCGRWRAARSRRRKAAGSRAGGSRCGCRSRRAPRGRRAWWRRRAAGRGAASPRRRSEASPSKVRSKPPCSGLTLPSALRSIAPPRSRAGEAGEDREVGDAHRVAAGVDEVLDACRR